MTPSRFHTNIEILRGSLPWTRSWLGDVTSASATSALVSDTREIGVARSTTTERPTRSVTTSASVGAPATGAPSTGAAPSFADSVALPNTARMRMRIRILAMVTTPAAQLPARVYRLESFRPLAPAVTPEPRLVLPRRCAVSAPTPVVPRRTRGALPAARPTWRGGAWPAGGGGAAGAFPSRWAGGGGGRP